nr:hypothetical protein [Tanacetum cinerariifolium]
MTAHHNDWDTLAQRSESSSSINSSSDLEITALKVEMAKINKNLRRVLQVNQQVKAITPNYETCSGPHSYNDCPATIGQTQNVYAVGAYQGGNSYQPQGNRNPLSYRSDNYLRPPGFNQNQNRNNQNQNFQSRNQGNNHGISQGNNQGRNQFFQGASHCQNPPPAYQAPTYQDPSYQAPVHQPPIPQPQVVSTNEFNNYMKENDAILKNMKTNMTSLNNSNLELKNMFGQFMKMNTASSSGLGTLLSNTITNPKEDLKGIVTRSGNAYQGPTIPTTSSSLPQAVEREIEVTKDPVNPINKESTKDVQPLVVQVENPIQNSEPIVSSIIEPVVAPVSAPKPNQKPSISFADALILMPKFCPAIKTLLTNKDKLSELARTPLNEHCSAVLLKKLPEKLGGPDKFLIAFVDFDVDPRVPLILGRSFFKTERSLIDVFEGELTLRVGKEAITFNLDQTSRYSANYNDRTANRIDVIDMACEEYSQEVLDFSDVIASGNPTPYYDLIVSTSSPTLLILGRSFLKTRRALIDVFEGELTLRVGTEAITFNLDQTSRYPANYNDMTANRIDVIDMACEEYSDFLFEEGDAFLPLKDDATSSEVDQSYYDPERDILLLEAFLNDDPSLPPPTRGNYMPQDRKELKICEAKNDKSSIDEPPEEKAALIKVLKSHKQAIAWKLSDIKGINPEFCTHKLLMEDDFEPAV